MQACYVARQIEVEMMIVAMSLLTNEKPLTNLLIIAIHGNVYTGNLDAAVFQDYSVLYNSPSMPAVRDIWLQNLD